MRARSAGAGAPSAAAPRRRTCAASAMRRRAQRRQGAARQLCLASADLFAPAAKPGGIVALARRRCMATSLAHDDLPAMDMPPRGVGSRACMWRSVRAAGFWRAMRCKFCLCALAERSCHRRAACGCSPGWRMPRRCRHGGRAGAGSGGRGARRGPRCGECMGAKPARLIVCAVERAR